MSSSPAKLLLVDDDAAAIRVLSSVLAEFPEQRFALSGEQALEMIREDPPDLVLLDAQMPGLSGIETCREIKLYPAFVRIPVILVTAHGSTTLEVEALEAGAADFVTKPYSAAQVGSRVRAQLRVASTWQAPRPVIASPSLTVTPPTRDRARLLIVDDDATAILMLREALEHLGDCFFARQANQALALAAEILPDLILIDARMPNANGFELCEALRRDERYARTPMVFVTRYADSDNEMRALDMGASDFIAKPYSRAVLQARIRNLLALKRQGDAELSAVEARWRTLSDARTAEVLGASSDGILTCDAEGRIVLANAAACDLLGADQPEIIQRRIGDVLEQDVLAWPMGAPQRRKLRSSDDTLRSVEILTFATGSGDDTLTTVVLRDLHAREQFEAEARARLRAEAVSQAKTMMMSYVAHEMGNPLNALMGFAQLIVGDATHPLPEVQQTRFGHVLASANMLDALRRDLLDLGRLELGRLRVDCTAVDAVDSAREALVSVTQDAQRDGIALRCELADSLPPVQADRGRLHQCLVNLLSNAIKYGRRGGTALLQVVAEDGIVRFTVSDDGIGMDALQKQHLFEPFNRLGQDASRIPGAGLGLLITRQLVEAMGGQLSLRSVEGHGSAFTLALPSVANVNTATPH